MPEKERRFPPPKSIEDPEILKQVRNRVADMFKTFPSENAAAEAEKIRNGVKIPWNVIVEDYLIGTMANKFRIMREEEFNKARLLFFEGTLEEIQDKIEAAYHKK
ncbi:MAG: hypothetical protein A2Y82_03705 [Candidatus Buchananbacteria bacterium RBG_13_36_9]|uniref:Uncharacterized protein n=1 Tax=Candidatus Buchananbacteria bacterium RBG_13_36_9 TaxID=1797530 RepID=A0A1G1XLM7_9BACT|nr:MAG: hypothetical protein A2Y82_03705 [Candidatus Buchananbacteria bacterium RBG_13_36_9]